MSETPGQMAARLEHEVREAADMHLSVVEAAQGLDLDGMWKANDGHREMFQSGVAAGYNATMQVLQRWGLLPGGERSDLSPEVLDAQRGKIAAAWDEGASAASPHGGAYLRSLLIENPYREDS